MHVEILEHLGQLRRVQLGQRLVAGREAQDLALAGAAEVPEGLHEFPGDQVVAQLVVEQAAGQGVHGGEPAETAEEAAGADVDVDQAQPVLHAQQVQVVDPHHAGAERCR